MTGPEVAINKSQNITHIRALDDLRAYAALMVLFAHITHNLTRGIDPSFGSWLFPPQFIFSVIAEGHAGVSLFLVLSGFLFAYGAHNQDIDYFAFIRNRVLRIYPLYVLMLILGAYTSSQTFSFVGLLSSLFLFANTQGALNGGAFTILLWTISVEFMFYLIFPFLNKFKIINGISHLVFLLLLCIALRYLCIGLGANARDISYFTIVGRIDQFLIGMIAAYLFCSGRISLPFPRIALIASILLIIASLFALNRAGGWISEAKWKGLWHSYEAILFTMLTVSYIYSHPSLNSTYTQVVGRVGDFSYSIYLLHMPLLLALQNNGLYFKYFESAYSNAMITALYFVPLLIAISAFSYALIERPFMSLRGKYLKPIESTGCGKINSM